MIEDFLQGNILEAAINAALNLDPQAAQKLSSLNGRRVSVALEEMAQTWVFSIENARLYLADAQLAQEADVRLRGNIGGFLQLFRGGDTQRHSSGENKLYIEGDLYAAQQFQRVMADLSPDFEGILRARLGERAGGIAASAVQILRSQGQRAKQQAEQWLQAFVQSEAGFVNQDEFAKQTAELERLQARLQALEQRLSQWEKQ